MKIRSLFNVTISLNKLCQKASLGTDISNFKNVDSNGHQHNICTFIVKSLKYYSYDSYLSSFC